MLRVIFQVFYFKLISLIFDFQENLHHQNFLKSLFCHFFRDVNKICNSKRIIRLFAEQDTNGALSVYLSGGLWSTLASHIVTNNGLLFSNDKIKSLHVSNIYSYLEQVKLNHANYTRLFSLRV